MQRIQSNTDKEIWIHEHDGASPFSLPFTGEFVCLIWNERDSVLDPEITSFLLEHECRYILCGGDLCDEQELEIDRLHVERMNADPKTPHIMTTNHEGESIEELTDFALNCTDFDDCEFSRYLILYVGEGIE